MRIVEHAAGLATRGPEDARSARASATVHRLGDSAWVGVRVSARWPDPAPIVAARVADRVRGDLARWVGLTSCDVDVLVEGYDLAPTGGRRVR